MTITAELLEATRQDIQHLGDQLDAAKRQRDDARNELARAKAKLAVLRDDLQPVVERGHHPSTHDLLLHAWSVLVGEEENLPQGEQR